MNLDKNMVRSLLLMVALFLFVVAGCATKEEKEAEHLKRAKEYIEKQELKKAVIELRNVVQLNPNNDQAHYQLERPI